MRWYTEEAFYDEDEATWDRMLVEYLAHVASIAPRLSPDVLALANDPELHLHDAEFIKVKVEPKAREIQLVVRLGDDHSSRLDLRFSDAQIVPDNYQKLAYAIGAEYRADHWGTTHTVIRYQEVDIDPMGRMTLRLGLWPFHEFAIEFGALVLTRGRSLKRRVPGQFVLIVQVEGDDPEPPPAHLARDRPRR
jgi:hypothetical protein